MVAAYTVYFGVCMGSALFGVFGAVIFLIQVIRSTTDAYPGKATSLRWILIMLAISDLFADVGKCNIGAYNARSHLRLREFSASRGGSAHISS